jgi:hypothetical protein
MRVCRISASKLRYGLLGAKLGDALNFQFDKLSETSDTDWCSSVIGMLDTTPRPKGSLLHVVMHHELAAALADVFPAFRKTA